MKKFLLVIWIWLLFSPACLGAETTDWSLDLRASSIGFRGKSTLHDFEGKAVPGFSRESGTLSGRLSFSKGGATASGEVRVPVRSLATGNKVMDRNMYAMFEAQHFPSIGYHIEPLDLSGVREGVDIRLEVRGVLTIHGVSHEARIPADVRLDHGRYVFKGSFPVSLKHYRLKAPGILFLKVADQVEVNFSAVFISP